MTENQRYGLVLIIVGVSGWIIADKSKWVVLLICWAVYTVGSWFFLREEKDPEETYVATFAFGDGYVVRAKNYQEAREAHEAQESEEFDTFAMQADYDTLAMRAEEVKAENVLLQAEVERLTNEIARNAEIYLKWKAEIEREAE